MKKILISLAVIGVVAAVVVGATVAYFNDTEISTGNIFVAGDLDLKVDHVLQTYNGNECMEECEPNTSINLVTNGSFEAPVVEVGAKWDIFPSVAGSWTIEWREDIPGTWGGWTRPDPANIELHRGVLGPAYSGEQYAELDSDWNDHTGNLNGEPASTKVYQDISTVPGKQYQLKFAFSPRPNTPASDNMLEVNWGGGNVVTLGPVAGGSGMNWTAYSYTVTASSDTTRIEFIDRGTADSLGTFVDDVKIHPMDCDYQIVGGSCILWDEKDLGEGDYFFMFDDVKPGDYGRNVISLHAYSNDAWACMFIHDKQDNDNGLVDPEEEAGDTGGGDGEGELSSEIEVFGWMDSNGDGVYDPNESPLSEESLDGDPVDLLVADSITGEPLTACETYYVGLAWCFGNQTVNHETGEISCDGSLVDDMTQTDSLEAKLTVYVEQHRNNPDFQCSQVVLPSAD